MRQPALLGELGGAQRARQHGFDQHVARVERLRAARVLVHQLGEELLVEAPPVDADAYRPVVREGDLDDGAEVPVAALRPAGARTDAAPGDTPAAARLP